MGPDILVPAHGPWFSCVGINQDPTSRVALGRRGEGYSLWVSCVGLACATLMRFLEVDGYGLKCTKYPECPPVRVVPVGWLGIEVPQAR